MSKKHGERKLNMKKKLLIPLFLAGMVLPLGLPKDDMALAKGYFIGEFNDRTKYIKHGTEVNGQMADEGFVLLKNDGTLPLGQGARISICGKSSTNLARGGAGSGSGSVSQGVTSVDLEKSLKACGYTVNPDLIKFYGDSSKSGSGRTNGNTNWSGVSQVTVGETPMSKYSESLIASFDEYNDLAIQVITREGSEGCDVKSADCRDSNSDPVTEKHALELSDNEQALFDTLKEHFNKVMFVINSSNIFECDALEKDDKVAAILWIGNPGDVGPGAVGRILCGAVNPSGRTVDTWARDFTKDPTFQNFSDNQQTNPIYDDDGKLVKFASQDTMFAADGAPMMSKGTDKAYTNHSKPRWADKDNLVVSGGINGVKPSAYVSYEEGIYVDYRYYETRYADMAKKSKKEADKWYNGEEGVVYPFGYGLSYTTFSQEIVKVDPVEKTTLDANNDLIEISVKVKNTGEWAGKEVVQAYWKAPYKAGEIEKADHVLCAFGKTEILDPGAEEIVHLTFHLQDVANYDFTDANKNGFKGYELDDGKYELMINKNAHEMYDSVKFNVVNGGIKYENDRFTGNKVENRFTDRGFYSSMPGENDIEFEQMSRADFAGTFPHHPTVESRTVKEGSRFEEFLTHQFNISDIDVDKNWEYMPEAAYKTAEDAEKGQWSQAASTLAKANRIQLKDMKGLDFDDPKWNQFVNEATYAEMITYVENNRMSNPSLSNIGKDGGNEGDGPQKFSIMWWVSSPIVAATFNQKLAHEQGECVGMESQISGKSGWWGPAVNTHRSPFGGRNFEYYAADPFLMGRMAAQVVGAATDRGVYAYFKHFAVNDQEKNRESGISFVNEQALREIYLKAFQMVFEEGKATGVMGSYNRLGLMETAGSYPLMTEVLRGEWGFKGTVLSDMTHSGNSNVDFKCYENVTNRCIAGCNLQLDQSGFNGQTNALSWDATLKAPVFTHEGQKVASYTWWNAIRNTYKCNMYMYANCTATAKGVTMVTGQSNLAFQVGTEITLDVRADMAAAGKDSSSATIEMNYRCDLPEGLTLEDGVISGTINKVGLYRLDVIVKNGSTVNAYKYVIEITPDMTTSGLAPAEANLGLIIGLSAGGVVVLAAAAVVVVLLLKKKKAPAAQ